MPGSSEQAWQIRVALAKVIRINHMEPAAFAESGDEFFGQRSAFPHMWFSLLGMCRHADPSIAEKKDVNRNRVASGVTN
jgi:hypothetical protein